MNSEWYACGHKDMQNESHNSSNNLDKCEPQQQSGINNVDLEPALQSHNLTLSFCSGSKYLVSCSVLDENH